MNPVFAHTFYFLAFVNPKDAAHKMAIDPRVGSPGRGVGGVALAGLAGARQAAHEVRDGGPHSIGRVET